MKATFHQRTGLFTLWTYRPFNAVGYAGRELGRNNPLMQRVKGVGPLPRGNYKVAHPIRHPRLGPVAFPLEPSPDTDTFGRSGFFIHGDNARGNASHGCIILPRHVRDLCERHGLSELEVRE